MTAAASLHHLLHSHHHRRLYYATLHRRILANNQSNNSRLSRSIVTSSIPPSADVFIERPEIIVLAEGTALYNTNSWDKVCKQYFTNCGMHYANVDIFQQHPQQRQRLLSSRMNKKRNNDTRDGDDNVLHNAPVMSLENLEMTLTYDLSRLGTETSPFNDEHYFNDSDDSSNSSSAGTTSASAHVVLIARGPIQCLVAQYFLESSPLAGLILIDPLLLPDDGRRESTMVAKTESSSSSESRWTTSLMELISIIEQLHPPPKNNEEIAFLHSLLQQRQQQQASSSRPLQLEAGAVPMLILYSDNDTIHRDTFRICAERTGAYHTFVGGNADHYDQVPVIKIPKKKAKSDDNDDDLQSTMRLIYEWYDEVVA